ncbi:MAG: NAD(+)/NADH kinase [Firmicutes bacterium]|nr:NAD(+)/NADH kinase [Bacillota bacterium]
MTIGLVPHLDKPQALTACRELVEWLELHGIRPCCTREVGARIKRPDLVVDETGRTQARLLVVLGGDGTLLSVVRRYVAWELPILGINFGKLGFLTEIELQDMFTGMERVLQGDYKVQERMLLRVVVQRRKKTIKDLRALNEMVISKGAFSRMLELHMAIDGQRLDPLPADGVIVATPTGSTAYSLSAGGPIVAPDIGVLLLTPICPHSLHARPMVISPASTVQIRVQAQHEDILLTIDGQESCPLELGDQVVISRAKEVARFVKVSANGFFDVLRQKLGGPPSCYREGEL